jgi:hypothetical protein
VGLGAALALLAMLGIGEHTDVLAHLFGSILGVGAGAIAGRAMRRPPRRSILQPLAAAAAGLLLGAAWLVALHAPLAR